MTTALDRVWPAAARAKAREAAAKRAQAVADRAAQQTAAADAEAVRVAVLELELQRHDEAVQRIADIVALPEAAGRERSAFLLAAETGFEPEVIGAILGSLVQGVVSLLPTGDARRERLATIRRAAL